jgi:aldose sugar dehydrogenase
MPPLEPRACASALLFSILLTFGVVATPQTSAQTPEILRENLDVRAVVTGLMTPTTLAFLADDDFLVLEKNTGQVQRIIGGSLHSTVLDLAVNFASERGLLGIALHPAFPDNPGVYLYWTESTSGTDSNILAETPLLGNRVDRFVWDGASLMFDTNLLRLRAAQPAFSPFEETARGNHNGGVIRFGPDGKLYVFIGDVGRRGWMQNIAVGVGPNGADDQFGGPEPDDAHLTGVVLRLNDDGTTPTDNPFYAAGSAIGGEIGVNVQKIFSYGHRNGFGMDFDPVSGVLWLGENGDDAFAEINRVLPGMNGGWIQVMGPIDRLHEYKTIETGQWPGFPGFHGLQQLRWSPESIADSPEEALARLVMLPGAHYADPVFSWRFVIEPAGLGFMRGRALGPQFDGDLFVGGARDFLEGGHLFHLKLTGNRRKVGVDDPRLKDRVDDNHAKWTIEESEEMLFGRGFGIITDIKTSPQGTLYVTSLTHGAIYEIYRRHTPPGHAAGRGRRSLEATSFPDALTLASTHPNPFNPQTTIRYGLAEEAHVRLEIFDLTGRQVALLVDRVMGAGWQHVEFNASGLASGMYVVRLNTGLESRTSTIVLMK